MSDSLHQRLAGHVDEWRKSGYPSEYPMVAVMLRYASGSAEGSEPYLRRAQVRALETYWYLRVVLNTPRMLDLYRSVFDGGLNKLLEGLSIQPELFSKVNFDFDKLLEAIRDDDDVVRQYSLEPVREALSLDYASYIFALAMGTGKTVLIGAIIASEFALAMEYSQGPFIRNALVFAPGKTIIESLREIASIPYERILPHRMSARFLTGLKLVFTQDGEKHIPVVQGSDFNVVVTNTEKIRIRKESIRQSSIGTLRFSQSVIDAKENVANARLQMIASLPALGIFSDEAHHTYGQALGKGLKKVRRTVDYLSENTNVVCVINTTGTPYFQRQPLREVVVWYGLSEGIADRILKRVSDNIVLYNYADVNTSDFVSHVIEDFFASYGDVCLPNGAPAKLAMYFPQIKDLDELRPVVEAKLSELGYPPSVCLANTTQASADEKAAFNRLNDPSSPYRVILLVNIGTEGWNCPSLFACALARELRSSNNFVLQAASRCLREVPGNDKMAKMYLSNRNYGVLSRELKDTYGEDISALKGATCDVCSATIQVRKTNLAPLVVRRTKVTHTRRPGASTQFTLTLPSETESTGIRHSRFKLGDLSRQAEALLPVGVEKNLVVRTQTRDLYSTAVELMTVYRLDYWQVYDQLVAMYPERVMPRSHVPQLAMQIEEQTCHYDTNTEIEEHAVALVKTSGFSQESQRSGEPLFTAEIRYPVERTHLLLSLADSLDYNPKELSFHYDPYLFDSPPEKSYLKTLLRRLGEDPANVEDVFFTGGLTDPKKTDFYVEYRGEDGRWHRYTPDFVIRRTDNKHLIVEVKAARFRSEVQDDLRRYQQGERPVHPEGRKAVALREWEELNSDRLKYQMIFVDQQDVSHEDLQLSFQFMEEAP